MRSCSEVARRAEQVYVRLSQQSVDPDGTHPIELDAWVGYSSVGRMHLTRAQARELIPVLLDALARTEGPLLVNGHHNPHEADGPIEPLCCSYHYPHTTKETA